ncbi:MAG TPA: hypothetical protein VEV41_15345 [Terriglobales bacterium]|nr:hypothetical protein [Terriglobales bacterium]
MMQTRCCIQLPAILLAILIFIFPATTFAADQQAAQTASAASSDYAGTDTCRTCHQDIYEKGFERTPHFKTTLKNGQGCQSCHGPGAEHVAGGGDVSKIVSFKNIAREEANQRCLTPRYYADGLQRH